MNFARDVVEAADPTGLALVERSRDGDRREWTFGEVAERSGGDGRAPLRRDGVRRGDVVLTLIGNRPEWVLTMVACFRSGDVVLPCTEQLRAKDLRLRLDVARPAVVVCDERNRRRAARGRAGRRLDRPRRRAGDVARPSAPAAASSSTAEDPCLITFTSGTAGEPKAVVHAQRYLPGQRVQAEHWLDARPGELVWCTAASGWSKSARNVFIAPWLRGAAALLHDARFDPDERLDDPRRASPSRSCAWRRPSTASSPSAPQPRPVADLRGLVAAGEALNPEVLRAWHEATGLWIRDGYGQTETGQITGMPLAGEAARPGSMGRPLPGMTAVDRTTASSSSTPRPSRRSSSATSATSPPPHAAGVAHRRPRRRGRRRLPLLRGPHRRRDHLRRLPDRPVRGRVGARRAPRGRRGRGRRGPRRRARRGRARGRRPARRPTTPSDALARELQDHVKAQTAPYKYPRIVDFADELPKTASGKVRRAALRQ